MATAVPVHGSKARLYANALDLTPFVTTVTSTTSTDTVDSTGFGAAATSKVSDPRVKGQMAADGYFAANNTTTGVTGGNTHAALSTAEGIDGSILAHCVQDILGAPSGWLQGSVDQYKVSSPTNEVSQVSMDAQSNVGIEWAEILHPGFGLVESAAGNGTPLDDGALSTNGCVLYLMVLALTGTSITCSLQSATTLGGTYAAVSGAAFAAVPAANAGLAAGCLRLVVPPTTINRAVRVNFAGTFTAAQFLFAMKRL